MRPQPFFHSRRVAFGECDPARIYYTPRAVEYAVEAIEAWYSSMLGFSFAELIGKYGLEAYFLRAKCDFIRPLTAGQVFRMRVTVVDIEGENIRFRIEGGNDLGEPYFRVELLACFAERKGHAPVPIPPEYRNRIEACLDRRIGEFPFRGGGKGLPGKPDPSAGTALFLRRRRILYGDCGPSGTIHPPKTLEYATEAIGEWFEEIMGVSWLELVSVRGQGAPMVAAQCEYLRPMVPDQDLTMGILVIRLGKASIGFAVEGRDADGAACFDAQMVVCYIDQREGFRSMPIPEEFHRRIESYRAACEAKRAEELRNRKGETE